jgi:hypothetical protein
MEAHVFDFPKDETIIQALVEMTTAGDDIVMDFLLDRRPPHMQLLQQIASMVRLEDSS